MTARAMTVLPEPVPASSTPKEWASIAATASPGTAAISGKTQLNLRQEAALIDDFSEKFRFPGDRAALPGCRNRAEKRTALFFSIRKRAAV
jgi:hypothetical protein